jgi:hypothetical protein
VNNCKEELHTDVTWSTHSVGKQGEGKEKKEVHIELDQFKYQENGGESRYPFFLCSPSLKG